MLKFSVLLMTSIFSWAAPAHVLAQSVPERFDRYYQALHQDGEMNGNIAVSQNGRVIYQRSFGFADAAANQMNGPETQFELASISKLFTAVAILQLRDQGKLELDSSFRYYFPQFPYPGITIRHLLAHTSGLPDTETLVDSILSKNPSKQFTIHDELENVYLYSRNHVLPRAGEKWMYSSAGYHLLALLVEKISLQTLSDYTAEHIFRPAGMTRSYIQTALSQKQDAGRAKNYQYNNHFAMQLQFMDTLPDWREWTYNLALETGGTGVISTTGDMLKFNEALIGGKLLKPETFREATTPFTLNDGKPAQPFDLTYCGLGWFIFKDSSNGKTVWGSGANPGAISFMANNIDRHECMVVLHNVKCNPFHDVTALALFREKELIYHPSFAFHYAQELYGHGRRYADDQLKSGVGLSKDFSVAENDFNRASLEFRRAGLKDFAIAVCETHIRLFPQSPVAFREYAAVNAEYHNKALAIAGYQKVLALDPHDQDARKALKALQAD